MDPYEAAAAWIRGALRDLPKTDARAAAGGGVAALLGAGLDASDAMPEGCELLGHARGAAEALARIDAAALRRFPAEVVTACGRRAPLLPMQLAAAALIVDGCAGRSARVRVQRRKSARGADGVAQAECCARADDARAELLCAPTGTGKTATCLAAAAHVAIAQADRYAAAAEAAGAAAGAPLADVRARAGELVVETRALALAPAHLVEQWRRAAALQAAVQRAHYGRPLELLVLSYADAEREFAADAPQRVFPVVVYDEADENLAFAPARPPAAWRAVLVAASARAAALRVVPLDRQALPPNSWVARLLAGAGGAPEERLARVVARDALRGARRAVLAGAAARMPARLERRALAVHVGEDWESAAAAPRAATTLVAAPGGAAAVAAAVRMRAPPDALGEAVDALATRGAAECPVCYYERRAFMVAPCCAVAVCAACAARHASASTACLWCRAQQRLDAPPARLIAAGEQPLAASLDAVESAQHASLEHAVAAAAAALARFLEARSRARLG